MRNITNLTEENYGKDLPVILVSDIEKEKGIETTIKKLDPRECYCFKVELGDSFNILYPKFYRPEKILEEVEGLQKKFNRYKRKYFVSLKGRRKR